MVRNFRRKAYKVNANLTGCLRFKQRAFESLRGLYELNPRR